MRENMGIGAPFFGRFAIAYIETYQHRGGGCEKSRLIFRIH